MGGYLVNFSVYTMAMIGLIFFALMIYKKFAQEGFGGKKSGFLGVEDTINIAPRKNLYVIRAGKEKFLIAGDVDKTTLISKLDETSAPIQTQNAIKRMQSAATVDELPSITAFHKTETPNVLHNMVRKINR